MEQCTNRTSCFYIIKVQILTRLPTFSLIPLVYRNFIMKNEKFPYLEAVCLCSSCRSFSLLGLTSLKSSFTQSTVYKQFTTQWGILYVLDHSHPMMGHVFVPMCACDFQWLVANIIVANLFPRGFIFEWF